MWWERVARRRGPPGSGLKGAPGCRNSSPSNIALVSNDHLELWGSELQHAHDRQGQVERPVGGRWLATPGWGQQWLGAVGAVPLRGV